MILINFMVETEKLFQVASFPRHPLPRYGEYFLSRLLGRLHIACLNDAEQQEKERKSAGQNTLAKILAQRANLGRKSLYREATHQQFEGGPAAWM